MFVLFFLTTIAVVHSYKVDHVSLLKDENAKTCNTEQYRNSDALENENVIVMRRGCSINIGVALTAETDAEKKAKLDVSIFDFNAVLQASSDESLSLNKYLSWHSTGDLSGNLALTIPSDAYVGKFLANLEVGNTHILTGLALFVIFNPYNKDCDEFVEDAVSLSEHVENEHGLVWVGSSDYNSARIWHYEHFEVSNLDVAMSALRKLELQYRNDLVLVSRQITYGIGNDICWGRWSGSYTDCKYCHEASFWTNTTEMFNIMRDSGDKIRYCQCWVFASTLTSIGRSLGIATRSTTNFESSHDTDYNREIEEYFVFDEKSKTYQQTQGDSDDSIWNFHVWNEMWMKRHDFTGDSSKYNGVSDWNAVDSTPQEQSYGGNPDMDQYGYGAYQMGPAMLSLVKQNINTDKCKHHQNEARFGCYDNEFVISETNANYTFWFKKSTDSKFTKFHFLTEIEAENDPHYDRSSNSQLPQMPTVGQLMSTKKPGEISDECSNRMIQNCESERLVVTSLYKNDEPSGPGIPTDRTNYAYDVKERSRRRRRALDLPLENTNMNIEYTIESEPKDYYLSPMIVAMDPEASIDIYGDDFTFGMMEFNLDNDAVDDDVPLDVYCSLTVTAQNYRGENILVNGSDVVKSDSMWYTTNWGVNGWCQFALKQEEYAPWLALADTYPFSFKFTLSVSIFESANYTEVLPLRAIVEQRKFMVCNPEYMFADRILCANNGLNWFKPSYGRLDYECDYIPDVNASRIGDGFCDAEYNVAPCFDGGDCCALSCVPSDSQFCENMDCIDDRVAQRNTDDYDCDDPLTFIEYMNALELEAICIGAQEFECPSDEWMNSTGNECIDMIAAVINESYSELKVCSSETVYALSQDMYDLIEDVTQCMDGLYGNDTDVDDMFSSTSAISDTIVDDKKSPQGWVIAVVIAAIVVVALVIIGALFYVKRRKGGHVRESYVAMVGNDAVDAESNTLQ
eukprot:CAMPEP_0202726164 /NCGR_PEP_ID=MMETSP1385-20130828/184472_1 /ASSEMBLY_ACC=CAM_ASM_000861 /TAXON_ID=933848 /ORGANISM="Elphidium margaritaceum" /LENGTH=966 /DNA_ID=CAMNT_0049392377 /DNA_START=40 /DNA_END=2940 /DNA_ORIENTATION=-